MRVVLASRSPQRKQILDRLGIEFEVMVPEIEEVAEGNPADVVLENARRKAAAVHAIAQPKSAAVKEGPLRNAAEVAAVLVIGCDTDVVIDERALGKPGNEVAATEYLNLLSGRQHEVLSGLVLLGPEPGQERHGAAKSAVTFRRLAPAEVQRYVDSGEWRERAGGYAIQGLGSTLVERVDGDLSNVIGLPVGLLFELAPELGPR
jgi:septum formation protein